MREVHRRRRRTAGKMQRVNKGCSVVHAATMLAFRGSVNLTAGAAWETARKYARRMAVDLVNRLLVGQIRHVPMGCVWPGYAVLEAAAARGIHWRRVTPLVLPRRDSPVVQASRA